MAQHIEPLFDRIGGGPLWSKPIEVAISRGFGDRIERQPVEDLHSPILHRRNREWPQFVVAFWNVHPPQRLRMISSLLERVDGLCLLFWSIPNVFVYSRGVLALVFRHSSHGKGFATERVGQQVLQGLYLTPSAFLCCLDDTRLEPTHIAVSCRPVRLVPFHLTVGGRTSKRVRCHLLCLLCLLIKFSRQERPNGSLPAFAWDTVVCRPHPYPLHYEWPSLSPFSSARNPIGRPCGWLSFPGGLRGSHVLYGDPDR